MNVKNNVSLSEVWRTNIIEDLKGSKKLKIDLNAIDPLRYIPDGSPKSIVKVVTMLIRSIGVVKTSRTTGVPRSSIYSVMDEDSNPTLETVAKILSSVGYELAIVPMEKKDKE